VAEHETCSEGTAFFRELRGKARAAGVPWSGSLALTNRCNFRCAHCYIRGEGDLARELSTERWRTMIDEMTAAGTLFLLMTGGEPLLRTDFPRIYRYARQSGIMVTVFTNGTLVTDELVELFRELPPRVVDITLYGATEVTCRRVTGEPGAHERCWDGIRRLKRAGVRLALKTVIMSLNRAEFSAIEEAAREVGVRLRFDSTVCPRVDGDMAPTALRVSAEEAVRIETSEPARAEQLRQLVGRYRDLAPSDRMYGCSAGSTTFHVDAFGGVHPCVMADHIRYPIDAGGFMAAWKQVVADVDRRRAPPDAACWTCDKRVLCGHCPPLALLETGSEAGRVPFLCALGEARMRHASATTS
jgi:MoaA/NifB/PqqE/SkfB family radical SAM enzyme